MTDDAVKLLGRAAAAIPVAGSGGHSNRAAQTLVRLLLEQGQAREALRRVDDLQHEERLSSGDAEFLRGMIQEKLGDPQGAFYSYVRASQYHPDDVDALVATSLAAQRASRADMARQYARRALDASHHDLAVRERLATVIGP
jgi:tetratricopeptide (TPR) repeat protein